MTDEEISQGLMQLQPSTFGEYADSGGREPIPPAEQLAVAQRYMARKLDPPPGPPLTHFFHCWRFPDHHGCAVALIERQGEENTALIQEAGALKRVLRDHGIPVPGEPT